MKVKLVAILVLATATAAYADDGAGRGGGLALGGAARSAAEGMRMTIWDAGSVAAGFASPSAGVGGAGGKGMQVGGFLAWRGDGYRFDATLAPSAGGNLAAGFGATAGALPGEPGTSYSLRLGADWAGDRFTVNPASGLGFADVVRPNSDVNLTVTINHSLTPGLSVIGTAEARRSVGATPDGLSGQNRFLFGAGLGYRF
jgi:hypothetical protein